ncbi:hypothetical protein BOW25_07190 [Solemya velum gill symbiont]|nr:hypothetical protein BOW25_07190 [Solemya velum gill symbiont]
MENMFCSHYRSEFARNNRTPIAVTFGWALLGLALILSFNFWLTSLIGLGLLTFNGYHLVKSAVAVACCMRQRKRKKKRTGIDPGQCAIN